LGKNGRIGNIFDRMNRIRKAKQRWEWSFEDNGETQYVTAIEKPPVETSITAVRAAIVRDVNKGHSK
jgi:hypothetical protein